MLGISVDSAFAAAAFAEKVGLAFPLLGDWPRMRVSKLYETYNEERMISDRRTFVIDREGIIRAIIDGPEPLHHSQEALEKVRELSRT